MVHETSTAGPIPRCDAVRHHDQRGRQRVPACIAHTEDPAMLVSCTTRTLAWVWAGFFAIVAVAQALDLGVLHRHSREIAARQSLLLSAAYIAIGCGFG